MSEVKRLWSPRRRIVVGVVAILGIVFSFVAYSGARKDAHRHTQAEFIRRAEARSAHTRERIAHFEGGLFGLSNLLTADVSVSRHEFSIAANAMLSHYSGITALEWVGVVSEEKRAEIEAAVSAELGRPFQFTKPSHQGEIERAPAAREHYPILYIEPMEGNERAFGFDLAFGPTTKDLANARRNRQVTVSRRITLIQETADLSSIIFIWPVFKSIEEVPQLMGYVQGVFRLSDILTRDLEGTDGDALDILWIDPREEDPQYRELFSYSPTETTTLRESDFAPSELFEVKIPVGDRQWLALHRPNPAWLTAQSNHTPLWLLLSGLAITGLLSALLGLLFRRTHIVEQLVATRTEELEQNRLLLTGLMQSLPGMAYRCIPGSPAKLLYVSEGSQGLCGYPSSELLDGSIKIDDIIDPDDRDRVADLVTIALNKQQPFKAEYRITTRSGEVKWVLSQGHGIYDQAGEPILYEGLIIEITDRKLIEEQKLTLERKLFEGQKHESLGLMAGGVAHDFNNLLTGILGHAGLARMQLFADSTADKHLQEIEDASQRAAELCKQMLAFAGRGRLSSEAIDLHALIVMLKPLLQSTAQKKITLEYQTGDTPKITGDVSQIRQVILNLFVNAAEAIGEGAGTITICTSTRTIDQSEVRTDHQQRRQSAGVYAVLSVSDTGSGIPKENLTRIFDPFFTTKFTGRGLGLSAASGVITGHNGAIYVDSTEGHGATFNLYLPAADQSIQSAKTKPIVNQLRKALVIDDDQPVIDVVSELLSSMNIEAVSGLGGKAALEIFQEQPDDFDLVLLDIVMPDLNGPETLTRLRAIKPNVPVLMMSGLNNPETIAKLAKQGPLVFIAKPFSRSQLEEALNSLLAP